MEQSTTSQQPETTKTSTKIDRLKEDPPIRGQLYYLISYISPEGIKNCNIRAQKMRGVFASKEEADAKATELRELEPEFHIWMGEVGKWCPFDPDPYDGAEKQNFYEEEMQKLYDGYNEQQKKAQQVEKDRRDHKLEDAVKHAKKLKDEANKEEQNRKAEGKPEKKEKKEENKYKQEDQLLEEKRKELMKENNMIKQSESKLRSVDENINKVKELYEKLHKKHKKDNELPKADK